MAAKRPDPKARKTPSAKAGAGKSAAARAAAAKRPLKPVAAKAAPAKAAARGKPAPAGAKPVAAAKPQAVAPKPVAPKPVAPKAAAAKAAAAKPLVSKPDIAARPAARGAEAERPRPPKGVMAIAVKTSTAPVDDEGGSSLLAGPRNVTPYVAKRGEQYMGKAQLEHFHTILNTWKRDLMEEVDRTVSHMKDEAANFPDPNDRATQEEEFSLELRTRDRERKLIRKIDEALARIEDGSYGYCLETGEEIGIKRLEARPVATLSIEAQERRERRERQYGDRDDRYR